MTGKKEEALTLDGVVLEAVKGAFRVQICDNPTQPVVLAHLAGKLRKNFIKIVVGDRVKVEISPYDFTRGRITYRSKE
jgi:translation initiation factor IF-1